MIPFKSCETLRNKAERRYTGRQLDPKLPGLGLPSKSVFQVMAIYLNCLPVSGRVNLHREIT